MKRYYNKLYLVRQKTGLGLSVDLYFKTSNEALDYYMFHESCAYWGETYVPFQEYNSKLHETRRLLAFWLAESAERSEF